jgi:hypothetical protein
MLATLKALWNLLKTALFPPLRWAGARAFHPAVLWGLHLLVLVAVLVGLYFLASVVHLGGAVDSRWSFLRGVWLPLIFLLLYALAWLVWWVWKLLFAGPDQQDFPDIDEAWAKAVQALGQHGIQLAEVPLFLVLGRPEAPEECLFDAAHKVPWVVRRIPAGEADPVRVYGNRDGVFVTCAGASLLGKYAEHLAQPTPEESAGTADFPAEVSGLETPGDQTLRAPRERKFLQILAQAAGRQATGLERRALRRDVGAPMKDLLKDPSQVEYLTARLAYFCRLLLRDRDPLCPINGILLALPFGATDTEEDALRASGVCQRDLATVRRVLQLNCPLFVLVCDLETVPGFRELVQRYTPDQRQQRLGQRFPLATALAGKPLHEQVDHSLHALGTTLFAEWVYSAFHLEKRDGTTPAAATAVNSRLFDLLAEVHDRRHHLGRVVNNALSAVEDDEPLLYGGCYVAATGADKDKDQAFVGGVVHLLLRNQDKVSWTQEALRRDARDKHWASVGYVVLGGLWLAVLAVAGYLLFGPGKGPPRTKR